MKTNGWRRSVWRKRQKKGAKEGRRKGGGTGKQMRKEWRDR